MFKIALLIWVMAGVTLAGSLILIALVMPGFGQSEMQMIPIAGIAGFLIAMPLSYLLAKRISHPAH
ncbi:MAG: hypothetical protein KGR48_00190 [Alphaproteobacteria bacterium]|nr:hypothetical protein [Alphaproteobacteria bacterium]MBU6471704.1 hypothetical protein [Alphaproteobacteria bacterium]MDE2013365.1 hypothetical protein [Alphaproteobacteria bacterium]MDE2072478.1 hypothetical protein [Alphaproteobacteria bacterium]MDE2351232.1 hypothetical protein [Alphaproteobacteria bacterium]